MLSKCTVLFLFLGVPLFPITLGTLTVYDLGEVSIPLNNIDGQLHMILPYLIQENSCACPTKSHHPQARVDRDFFRCPGHDSTVKYCGLQHYSKVKKS